VRILSVGDLHYSLRQFDWIIGQAAEHDLVVLAGDQLDISSAVPLEAQIPVVLAYVERLAAVAEVAVASGNHDLTDRDANGEKSAPWLAAVREAGAHTDWDSTDVNGVRLTVCPWWDGPLTREAVDRFLASAGPDDDRPWVWVYHGPPEGSPLSWGGSRSYGDPALPGWIDRHQPTLVLTGHVHEAPFVDGGAWHDRLGTTVVFNAGRHLADMPAHVSIDLAETSVFWWSMQGEEELRF